MIRIFAIFHLLLLLGCGSEREPMQAVLLPQAVIVEQGVVQGVASPYTPCIRGFGHCVPRSTPLRSPRWGIYAGGRPLHQALGRVRVKPTPFLTVVINRNIPLILSGVGKPFRCLKIVCISMFGLRSRQKNTQLWCGFMVALTPVGKVIRRFSTDLSWPGKVSY